MPKLIVIEQFDRDVLAQLIEVLTIYKVARAERETQNVKFKGYWVQNILRVDIEPNTK